MEFEFSSNLPAEYLEDLELLMFFNPLQPAAKTGIRQSIEKYGAPRICIEDEEVRVSVGMLTDVQALFALSDSAEGYELAGLVLYVRTDIQNILVLHIAVTEALAFQGRRADAMLVTRLLGEVRHASRRLKGVRAITIVYPGGRAVRMAVRFLGPHATPSACDVTVASR